MKVKFDDKELKPKELSALYDRLYAIADKQIKRHNPCGIKIKKGIVFCNFTIDFSHLCYSDCNPKQEQKYFLCCGTCEHHSKTGCTVKNLYCKLFACPSMNKKVAKRLDKLTAIKRKYKLFGDFFVTKERYMNITLTERRGRLKYQREQKERYRKRKGQNEKALATAQTK